MFDSDEPAPPSAERLIAAIDRGECALFLGAGISRDAGAPSGQEMADAMAQRFLGSSDDHYSLPQVAALSEALEGRKAINEWIAELLAPLTPSAALLEIPSHRWRAIYTVNYDTLVEAAYRASPSPAQQLRVFYSDRDRLSNLRDSDVPLYKLHGSIDRANTAEGHLTITTEDHFTDAKLRRRLAGRLLDALADLTVFYAGFGREDPDFVRLMLQVKDAAGELVDLRRAYALQPTFSEFEQTRWDHQRITLIPLTADAFFSQLQAAERQTPAVGMESEARYAVRTRRPTLTARAIEDISRNFEIVDEHLSDPADADLFFRGATPTWGTLVAGVDARRDQADEVLEAVLVDSALDRGGPRLVVVHAEGGAGKSTIAKRAAVELVTQWDQVVIAVKPYGSLDFLEIEQFQQALDERVCLLVDNAARIPRELSEFLAAARRARLKITVLAAARTNEWREAQNVFSLPLAQEVELAPLSRGEIERILDALASSDSLGLLAGATREAQVQAFESRAQKQLLVALREATEGKNFDEIIVDEFNNIPTEDGQRAYLLVAALHRFGTLTRAGLLHRALNIPLADLASRVFVSTEKVIVPIEVRDEADYYYSTRHPLIADILVDRKMTSERVRLEYYETLLGHLDIGYSSDAEAFRLLSRGRNREFLRDFRRPESKRALMQDLLDIDPTDPFVHQHAAMLEMDLGQLGAADRHLEKATDLRPSDPSIRDTEGLLVRRMAESAERLTAAEDLYAQAEGIFERNIGRRPDAPIVYRNLAETYASWAKRLEPGPRRAHYLGLAYATLEKGLDAAPGAERLLQYQGILEEEAGNLEGAREAFAAALITNPAALGTRYMAAKLEEHLGDRNNALSILEGGLATNADSPELHSRIATLLAELRPDRSAEAKSHFEAALLGPVARYGPKLAYAAYLFSVGEFDHARNLFAELDALVVLSGVRFKQHSFDYPGIRERQSGRVGRVYPSYAWIEFARGASQIYWRWRGDRGSASPPIESSVVEYGVAFTLKGPVAVDVVPTA